MLTDDFIDEARKNGIWIYTGESPPTISSDFILLDEDYLESIIEKADDYGEMLNELDGFPARIFCLGNGEKNLIQKEDEEIEEIINKKIVFITQNENLSNIIEKIKDDNDNNKDREKWEDLKLYFNKKWVGHLWNFKSPDDKKKIKIDIEFRDGSSGGEISGKAKKKVLEFTERYMENIIENCIDNIISAYLDNEEEDTKKIIKNVIPESFLSYFSQVMERRNNIGEYFLNVNKNGEFFEDDNLYPKMKEYICDKIKIELELQEKLVNMIIIVLHSAVKSYYKDLKELVYKYEEDIETIPKGLKGKDIETITEEEKSDEASDKSGLSCIIEGIDKCKVKDNNFTIEEIKERGEIANSDIAYDRHFKKWETIEESLGEKYIESLSGAQTYFNMLINGLNENSFEARKLLLRLIENALLDVVILDERIGDYYSSDKDIRYKYKFARIQVPEYVIYKKNDGQSPIYGHSFGPLINKENDNNIEKLKKLDEGIWFTEYKEENNQNGSNLLYIKGDKKVYYQIKKIKDLNADVFIIHQGILDKMPFRSKEEIEKFIETIKRVIPWVFVTSGRGKPASLPSNVKFIPFASIDIFLKKSHPEKFLLTQVLMSIIRSRND